MKIRSVSRLGVLFGACFLACLLWPGLLVAQDAKPEKPADAPDLEARLKAIEEQNQQLRKQVDALSKPSASVVPPSVQPVVPAPEVILPPPPVVEAPTPAASEGTVVGSDLDFKLRWDHGLWAETGDKAFRMHIGGRTQFDTIWKNAGDDVMFGPLGMGRIDDSVAFRRARFVMEGTWYELVQFCMEYDFLNTFNDVPVGELTGRQTVDTPVPTDLWVQFDQVPFLGHIRIGNQKDPLSFEHMTSSRFLNFLERSLAFDAFIGGINNGFVPGITAFNTYLDKRLFTHVGVLKNNNSIFGFNVGDGETTYAARVTGLPVWEADGRVLVHLGCGYQYRDADDDRVRVRTRTAVRNGPAALHSALVDFTLDADNQQLVQPEFVVVMGPWTLQTEYLATWIGSARTRNTQEPRRTAFYQGYYCELLYMFTGEHRVYDRDLPRFGRVVPYENFFFVNGERGRLLGTGAWQLGLRYQFLDLNSEQLGANRGAIHSLTVGLNWFINPNLKIQANYTVDYRDLAAEQRSDGEIRGFGLRVASDW